MAVINVFSKMTRICLAMFFMLRVEIHNGIMPFRIFTVRMLCNNPIYFTLYRSVVDVSFP